MDIRMRILSAFSLCIITGISLKIFSKDRIEGGSEGRRNLSIQNNGIIHVISPFANAECDHPFCPFDQHRSIAIQSMLRAKQKSHLPIILAAAVFPEDRHFVPSGFITLPPLLRDTASEYPHIPNMKKLPFIQDIFDVVLNSPFPFEYVIYSNSDIILRENFYHMVEEKILDGYDAFTVNRQTVNRSRTINDEDVLYTAMDLDEIYELQGDSHPGFDCFIIRRNVLSRIRMGNIFVGARLFANGIMLQLPYLTRKYKNFPTYSTNSTYHLGDDRMWDDESSTEWQKQNVKNALCSIPDEVYDRCFEEVTKTCNAFIGVVKKILGEGLLTRRGFTNKGHLLCHKTFTYHDRSTFSENNLGLGNK